MSPEPPPAEAVALQAAAVEDAVLGGAIVDGRDRALSLGDEAQVARMLAGLILPGGMLGTELARIARSPGGRLCVLHSSARAQPGLRDLAVPSGGKLLHSTHAIGEPARRVRAVLEMEACHAN